MTGNAELIYSVGDPDPTPPARDAWCGVEMRDAGGPWECTWIAGHAGDHIAGDAFEICAIWPQDLAIVNKATS